MTLIKLLLTTGFVAALVWAFRNRSRAGMRASGRVLALVTTATAIVAVLFPETTVWAAHLVGVDRGTDLVLYVLTLVFFVTTMATHLRFRDLELKLDALVRTMALQNTKDGHDEQGSGVA
jgi:hypothetical protein